MYKEDTVGPWLCHHLTLDTINSASWSWYQFSNVRITPFCSSLIHHFIFTGSQGLLLANRKDIVLVDVTGPQRNSSTVSISGLNSAIAIDYLYRRNNGRDSSTYCWSEPGNEPDSYIFCATAPQLGPESRRAIIHLSGNWDKKCRPTDSCGVAYLEAYLPTSGYTVAYCRPTLYYSFV